MMNAEMEQFERHLSSQPSRQLPQEWRAEILSAARAEQNVLHSSFAVRRSWLSTFNRQLSTILWPHPKAWAGLAAVWVFIFIVNFSIRDKTPAMAEKSAPPSPEVVAQLKMQQRMLAELMGSSRARDAELPRYSPQPRSERMEILMT